MKKKFFISLLLVFALCLSFVAGAAQPADASAFADAKTYDAKIGHPMASTSFTQKVFTLFVETIREASEGTINMTIYPADTLVSSADAYDAVLMGNVEFAQFQVSYISGIMPEFIALEIPGLYVASEFKAFAEIAGPTLDAIFAKYGVKYLAPFPYSMLVFVGEKVVTDPVEDLQRSRVRVSGAWGGRAVSGWGASPMSIGIGDVPTALERNTINQVLTSWIATQGFRLHETAPHITLTQMQEILPGIIMNLDLWNEFTEAQQEAVYKGVDAFVNEGYELMKSEEAAFLDECREMGVELYFTTPENDQFYYDEAWKLADELIATTDIGELGLQLIEVLKDPRLAPGAGR